MDVLRPELVKVGTRIYRKNQTNRTSDDIGSNKTSHEVEKEYCERTTENVVDEYCDETCDYIPGLEQTRDGSYKLRLSVPAVCYGYIIGKKGETKKRIENETNTYIAIPKQGVQGDVLITGSIRRGVISAKTRIDLLVDSARQRQPFTHFLSIPLISESIKQKLNEFRKVVLETCSECSGIEEVIFQTPNHLHLTIGMLTLLSEAEVKLAADALKRCEDTIVRPLTSSQPLTVELAGLEIMNDDPSSVDVLYATLAPGQNADQIQRLVDTMVDDFVSSGLMRRERNTNKLHLTIMNSKFRQKAESEHSNTVANANADSRTRNTREKRATFDASKVLQLFADFHFGSQPLREIHLSERHNKDPATGYYLCRSQIVLPS